MSTTSTRSSRGRRRTEPIGGDGPRWARADWITSAIRSDRDKSVGRMVRLAAILVVVLGLLGLLFGRHDAGTAQTIDRAGRLQVLGSDNDHRASTTDAGPATGGNGSSSSPGGNSNGNASTSPQTSATGGPGGSGTAPGARNRNPSWDRRVTVWASTSRGSRRSASDRVRPARPPRTSGQPGQQPTSTTPPSGPGPGPGPTTTQAPQSTPTTATSPTTATTQPPTTPTTETHDHDHGTTQHRPHDHDHDGTHPPPTTTTTAPTRSPTPRRRCHPRPRAPRPSTLPPLP